MCNHLYVLVSVVGHALVQLLVNYVSADIYSEVMQIYVLNGKKVVLTCEVCPVIGSEE